ncbi:tolB protein precursor, periplasmic protein involved in the tonb-independent uptake of group A colicins [plant metagenome]|uniref:TolB protein, periplasmic protein involved in the tonb-independent uptake of group A colicins n=1 Tax=plant metagenome TaxID=1297885 RepID=A0A484SF23_9ZZZZ
MSFVGGIKAGKEIEHRSLRSRVLRAALLSCGAALCVLPLHAAQHVPSAAEVVDLKEVSDPQISPDGRVVAYTVETPLPDGVPHRRRIWRVATEGGSAPVELPAPDATADRMPRWSPDGAELAFLSTRPLPGHEDDKQPSLARTQLWKIGRDADAPQPVTASPGEVTNFAWSADGKRLAYLATDPQSAERKARIERKDDAIEVGRNAQFTRLWVQDATGGHARVLTAPDLQIQDVAWAPDGHSLALRVSDEVGLGHMWYRSRVVLVSASDGSLLRTVTDRASAVALQWSPDGTRLLYGQLGPYGHTGTRVVYTLADETRVVLGQQWPGSMRALQWRDNTTLIGGGLLGVRPRLLEVDASSGEARELVELAGPSRGFSLAQDGRIAFVQGRADAPPEVGILSDGTVRWLTDTNPQVRDWALGQVRDLTWRSSLDGREIHGVLVLPPTWRPGTRLPTLVQAHGGPADAWSSGWLGSWHDWAQSLAMRGYAVLLPNPRGSFGQGNAFAELARDDWGPGPFQDVLDGMDLIEAEGIVDPARVAIGGWSYGGYLSAWAVGHSDRFRTAIVGAAVIDVGVMALTTDIPYEYLPGYFGSVLERREAYDRNSPIRYAHNVKVPVLVLHGEEDKRVPVSQGEQFHRALKFNDTPVEMIRYPRGPHWFEAREQERDVLERVLGWLDTHL